MDDTYNKYNLRGGIFPCLTLHCNTADDKHIPNFLSMPLNYRKVDKIRFGIDCEDTDRSDSNLLQRLIHERDHDFPSFLSGHPFILVLTSFGRNCYHDDDENDCSRMKSSLGDDYDADTSYTRAVPLTLEIINMAITWLRGINVVEAKLVELVQDGLLSYFKLLQELICDS